MLPPEVMVTSWPRLPMRAMSGVVVLLQLGSVTMSVAQFITKGHADVNDLNCYIECVDV